MIGLDKWSLYVADGQLKVEQFAMAQWQVHGDWPENADLVASSVKRMESPFSEPQLSVKNTADVRPEPLRLMEVSEVQMEPPLLSTHQCVAKA